VLEISQYTFATGSSACTPIACFAVASIIERLDMNLDCNDSSSLTDAIVSGVASYTSLSNGDGSAPHLSVEEFYVVSKELNSKVVKLGEPIQGLLTNPNAFLDLINTAREMGSESIVGTTKNIGIVITKPPETVCITIPPIENPNRSSTYTFFDSHSRPEYGLNGSYIVTSNDMNAIVERLNTIFPANASEGLDDLDGSYMQMLYSTFEGTVFQRV
jgi:hypothetical protein